MSISRPVRIGLLGALELQVDGRLRPVNGPRRRSLLAVLAAALGRTVSSATLLDQVFEGAANPSLNTLQVHVSQLRALLAPYGGALERRGGGYRLDDERCQVDAVELDRAVDAARRAQNPTADEVTDRLRRAVGASRGTFCEDVPLLALEGSRVHYGELQVTAMEMLFDDELQHGAGADLAERIRRLLDDHPLRERLWGQLMLALYAAGRQHEALAAYRRAREVLIDEAGIDPGPALRELETVILRQDERLGDRAPAQPAVRVPTLVWLDAGGMVRALPMMEGGSVLVGRAHDCDIRIDWDPLVSRRHAVVTRTGPGFEVRDLGSRNGCSVDGTRVEGTASLPLRGVLQVGSSVIFLRAPTRRVGSRPVTRTAQGLPTSVVPRLSHPPGTEPSRSRDPSSEPGR
jgi:DNA-binding SARP family transcriptional activator